MARKLKVSSLVLNVRIHPHSRELYIKYFSEIYQLKKIVQLYGDRYGIISSINLRNIEDGYISGVISTFTKVDIDGEWFDADKLEGANDQQLSEIIIPDNLFPNSAQFYFYFYLGNHRLYVQNYAKGKQLTSNIVLNLFNGLASDINIVSRFNLASITLVQIKDALRRMFSIERIDKIEIKILKPNADILVDDFEEKIERHLLESHAREMSVIYRANPGTSLVPVDDIKLLSGKALENGSVEVTGRDDGFRVKSSSQDSPLLLQDKYDPEQTSEGQAFRRLTLHNQEDE